MDKLSFLFIGILVIGSLTLLFINLYTRYKDHKKKKEILDRRKRFKVIK